MRGSFYFHSFPFKWPGHRKTVSPTSCQWWWDCCGVSHLKNDQERGKEWQQHPKMSKRRGLQSPSRLRGVIPGLSAATVQPHRAWHRSLASYSPEGIKESNRTEVTDHTCRKKKSKKAWHSGLLCPWDFPGKNTGVDCHFLLQEILLTQGSNQCLLGLLP